jgi:hypothetical protein
VPILFGVRPVAVAVLEIEPEVLDGLPPQLVDHARPNSLRKSERVGAGVDVDVLSAKIERARQRRRVRCVLLERRDCKRSELRRRVSLEEMCAAIHRVDRLAIARFSGTGSREGSVCFTECAQYWF